jgi:hypothetical protein
LDERRFARLRFKEFVIAWQFAQQLGKTVSEDDVVFDEQELHYRKFMQKPAYAK